MYSIGTLPLRDPFDTLNQNHASPSDPIKSTSFLAQLNSNTLKLYREKEKVFFQNRRKVNTGSYDFYNGYNIDCIYADYNNDYLKIDYNYKCLYGNKYVSLYARIYRDQFLVQWLASKNLTLEYFVKNNFDVWLDFLFHYERMEILYLLKLKN